MIRFIAFFVRLSRIHHSLGFGVQSPFAYSFIRDVINEKLPYYQYNPLKNGNDWLTHKLGKLYFRLANWRQPDYIFTEDYFPYFLGGCNKVKFGDSIEFMKISLSEDRWDMISRFLDRAKDDSILVVEGINHHKNLWKRLIADQRTEMTFDLYYCGIVLFDKKCSKQNYIVNF